MSNLSGVGLGSHLLTRILADFREDALAAYDCASLLVRHADPARPESRDLGQNIRASSRAILTRLKDITTMTALSSGEFVPQNIPFSLAVLLEGLARGTELQVSLKPDLEVNRSGDPECLRLLLRHLLENAHRHAPAGPVLLQVEAGRSEDGVVFSLVDVGDGPGRSVREFNPESLGLGLTLARQLAPLLQSRLTYEPRPRGSAAVLEMPLPPAPAEPVTVSSRDHEELRGLRVLVLERAGASTGQREFFTNFMRTTLEDAGVQLLDLSDPANRNGEPIVPDALVVEVDGFSEANWTRIESLRTRYGAGLALLVVASHPQRGDAQRFAKRGCQAMLVRPFEPEQLLTALEFARKRGGGAPLLTNHVVQPAECRTLRVGILDANATARFLTGRLLQRAGHEAVEFASLDLLMQAIEQNTVELVLVDLALDKSAGLQAAARIRAWPGPGGQVAMLAVTTLTDEESRRQMLEAGFSDVLAKPFRYEELARQVNLWGGRKIETEVEVTAVDPGPPEPRPAVDRAMLAQGSLNDPDFERELIMTFLIEGRQQLSALKKNCTSSNAHAFKGNAAVMGATQLAVLLQQMEQFPDPAGLPEIEAEYQRVEAWLRAHST